MKDNHEIILAENGKYSYISYDRGDFLRIKGILKLMNQADIPLWIDTGIPDGAVWETINTKKISECEVFILFVTMEMFLKKHPYSHIEYQIAERRGKKIIPVFLDDCSDMRKIPNRFFAWYCKLSELQGVNLVGQLSDKDIVGEISKLL